MHAAARNICTIAPLPARRSSCVRTLSRVDRLFKAMVMTAFPPIEALDDKAGSGWDNIRDFEQQQLNFLRGMDDHLVGAQAMRRPENSVYVDAAR